MNIRSFTSSGIFIIAAAALFFLGGMYSWFIPNSTSNAILQDSDFLTVRVKPVTVKNGYTTSFLYTGTIEASRESGLGFELGGKVVDVWFDEGDTVTAGDVLARLDTALLESRKSELAALETEVKARLDELDAGPRLESISEANSQVEHWQAQLEIADLSYQRFESLLQQESVTKQKRDEALYAKESAEAQLESAKQRLLLLQNGTRTEQVDAQMAVLNRVQAQIQTLETEISKATLTAPYDGVITKRFTDEGTVLQAGTPVLHLIERGVMKARIGIPQNQVETIKEDRTYSILVNGQAFNATIDSILPVRDETTRTVTVLFSFKHGEHAVRVGDLAKIRLETFESRKGFWLPVHALTESVRGLWSCYVVEQSDGVFIISRREVDVLHTEISTVYVQGSVQEGERVVVEGIHKIVPGQHVTVLESETR